MTYQIGRVIEARENQVVVSLSEYDIVYRSGVPKNMIINVPDSNGACSILLSQLGVFVEIVMSSGSMLGIVTNFRMREKKPKESEISNAKENGYFLLEQAHRELVVLPVGLISVSDEFNQIINQVPMVQSIVYAVSKSRIDYLYTKFAKCSFTLGKLSMLPKQDVKVNFDTFFSHHSAMLGQTGGGKSWAVSSIIQKISHFKQSCVVLFDIHGEYKSAFKCETEIIDASNIEIPYWLMNVSELLRLLDYETQIYSTEISQKLESLIQNEKKNQKENSHFKIDEIHADTPVYFSLDKLICELNRLNSERMSFFGIKSTPGQYFGQFNSIIERINTRMSDSNFKQFFRLKKFNTSASMDGLFRLLLGEKINERKKITVIDFSDIPDQIQGSVISLILRCLYEFAYWYSRVENSVYPIAIFADEAHDYLTEETRHISPKQSAELIAKKGKKFGVSLNIISQRPQEVASNILSQCGNFLCFRVSNPTDQSYIKNLLPSTLRGVTDVLPVLDKGELILIGNAVMMPSRITIDSPNPAPKSVNQSIKAVWNEEPQEINVSKVLDAWRNQSLNN